MRSLLYPSGLLTGIVVGSGCFYSIPRHCFNDDGDQTCQQRGAGMFCNSCLVDGDGCVDVMPAGDCHFAGPSDPSSTSGIEATSGETTTPPQPTTDPVEGSTGAMPCTGHDDCTNADLPFCEPSSGQCVTCDAMADPDGACAERSPEAPLCVAGSCVPCTPEHPAVCDPSLHVCDGASNTCVPCTEHAQCSIGACQLASGECFPPETLVVHVDGGSIYDAVMAVQDGDFGIILVHEDTSPYAQGILVDGDKTIALLAAPGEAPIVQGSLGDPGIRVLGPAAALYVEGLEISFTPSTGAGVEVDDMALARLDRSRIVQNSGGGISVTNDAQLTLRNCFVGGDVNDVHALEVDGASAEVRYTTLGAGFGAATALTCTQATVDVRNSLLVARTDDDEVQCPDAVFEHSAAEQGLGGTNVDLVDMQTSWFQAYGTGALHLSPTHPAAIDTAARWRAGDPRTDIDGDDRPTQDGAPDHAGADLRP